MTDGGAAALVMTGPRDPRPAGSAPVPCAESTERRPGVGYRTLRPGLVVAALALLCVFLLAAVDRAEAYVYWTAPSPGGMGFPHSDGPIGRANLDGSAVNDRLIGGQAAGYGIATQGSYIYWTKYENSGGGWIARANIDGSGINQHFISGIPSPTGIAVDGTHIYWASFTGSIGRANLDGTGVDQNFITGATHPESVVVGGEHVYWTNWFLRSSTIGRANLDGSGIDQTFINSPAGALTVDGAHLYWTHPTGPDSQTIARANLDGSGIDERFITGTSYGYALAAGGKYLYWSNPSGSIGRAKLDGTGVNNGFMSGVGSAWGLAVDANGPPESIAADLSCSPARILPGGSSTCAARITDTTGMPSTPTGTVRFNSNPGSFSAACTLSGRGATASCRTRYTAFAAGGYYPSYPQTIIAHYLGDPTHASISTASTMTVLSTQPQITNVSQSASRWREGNALPHYARAKPPIGTTFRYTIDRRARVLFTFIQTASGRPVATLSHQSHAGRNSLRFEGRINQRKRLAPGSYTLKIATAAGGPSKPATLRFTILRRAP